MVRKAVIPCAGFGTRFLPETKVVPKELFPVNGRPVLSYIVEEAIESGIEEILIIVSPQKEDILRYFGENELLNKHLEKTGNTDGYNLANPHYKAEIKFAVQSKMTGNGDAVYLAKEFAAGEPVSVLFGDDIMYSEKLPVTKQLIDAYEKTSMCVVGVQKKSNEIASKCGVVIENGRIDEKTCLVSGFIEKPDIDNVPSNLVSLGRFIVTPEIFDAIEKTPLRNGEVYLTDAINILSKGKDKVCAYEFDALRYDIGSKEGFVEANIEYSLRDNTVSEILKKYLSGLK